MRAIFIGGPLAGLRVETAAHMLTVPRRRSGSSTGTHAEFRAEFEQHPERFQEGVYRKVLGPIFVFTGWRSAS